MALRRTLEMLEAGERINDLLYRSTVQGSRRRLARRRAYGQASAGTRGRIRTTDVPS